MAWNFETDPQFQQELDWIDEFVREEIEPLDFIIKTPYDLNDPVRNELIKPLQKLVQQRKLWACHLGPELGGPGYGQVKLALMNEILGRAKCASTIRHAGPRHWQQRDPRPLWHAGAEGEVP